MADVASIIVTGGRTFAGSPAAEEWLRRQVTDLAPLRFFHGGAAGADTWAAGVVSRINAAARQLDPRSVIAVEKVPAEWRRHGRSAGPRRNREMARLAAEHASRVGGRVVVLAFPGGAGTADMVAVAESPRFRFEVRRYVEPGVGLVMKVQELATRSS